MNRVHVVTANSGFDAVKAIQDLISEQERIEIENEENLLLLPPHASENPHSNEDPCIDLSPLTSPDPTPPVSPKSNLHLELLSTPFLEASTSSSSPHASDDSPAIEHDPMELSPLTSPDPTPPPSPKSNIRLKLLSMPFLETSTSSSHPSDRPPSIEHDMELSPLTSPDPTPPVSPTSNQQLALPSISLLSTGKTPTIQLQRTLSSHKGKKKSTTSKKSTVKNTLSKKGNVTQVRKDNRKRAGNACRNRKRQEKREAIDSHYVGRRSAQEKYVEGATAISSDFSINNSSITKPGYVACHTKESDDQNGIYSLEDLVGEKSKFNFRLQEWDGSSSMGLLDAKNRIVAVLAGHPEDDKWSTVQKEAADALENLRKDCYIPKSKNGSTPRRGDFTALHCGVSYGGGQKKPQNLRNNVRNRRILDKLNHMKPFRRIAGFASSTMATWLPDLHKHYSTAIDKLHTDDDTLKQEIPSSVYCGASYNLGPKTVCRKHKDSENYACGECSVTSLGDFDYKTGGHLVLWDLRLVIEFPPGCTILLPSAIIAHSNVPIADHENRYSFVQYTSGALFRWIDHGLKSKREYLASLSSLQMEEEQKKEVIRKEKLYSMFPTVTLV